MVLAILALVVLALEAVSALLDCVGYGAVAAAAWAAFSQATGNKRAAERLRLKDAIVDLRRELRTVSSVDEFARWAKLRRRLDSASAEFERISGDLAVERTAFELYVNMALRAVVYGLRTVVSVYNYRTAVFYVPANWFYPVLWFLSLPAAPMGSVSVAVWAFACNRVCRRAARAVTRAMVPMAPLQAR
ncbi:GET complex subunit get1 [Coemansia nantahalensis]|uniref:GET complex subunit get1 n=1 Tax=Coemansia nantahalensis TaxID=2789366 RepID=A0ACC1JQN8_9FUNG|nr:GET complex subunit get1 [Coemansia nantahalensis]